ncbi:PhoX family phosphatase [Pseudomonas sp. SCB32]|nr:PhoX family phosphatase [Pseudomonas sp. SCB32]
MSERFQDFHDRLAAFDDQVINPSGNVPMSELIDPARRRLLKSSLVLGAVGFLGGGLFPGRSLFAADAPALSALLGFKGVPVQQDPKFDRVIVAEGYTARPFFSWGDPVVAGSPAWKGDASEDWKAQELQAGDNHDGMHYFPFPDAPDSHGLLVINHEYINPTLHTKGQTFEDRPDGTRGRPEAEVRKEIAAHGLSVIEVKKDASGQWQRVEGSRYNRRITGSSPLDLSGPLAGHDLLRTASDPDAKQVLGTLNNCSMGVTPWGTYLACEENWHQYFVNRDKDDYAKRVSHKRYGLSNGQFSNYYAWEAVDARFDATPKADQPHGGHVNEPNRFGWVVEIDPFDPKSTPKKRTAVGRFCRECSTLSLGADNRMAFYYGDDTKGEYIYKFVPAGKYDPANRAANRDLLDEGTLYVARFNADGSGRWLPLVHGQNGLTAENGFASQAEVLVNARAAADLLGATPMDRPEWVAVQQTTREVYVSLTNNDARGKKQPVDAANPRKENLHGQILRWNEIGADPTATTFQWEIFLLAGEQKVSGAPENLVGTINGDIFSSPDGLYFDTAGRLWIETDYDDAEKPMHAMGCNQLLCADPHSREVRRFLVGPRGCELTGITQTPDGKTLWVNIQHPGISFPASDGKSIPRSTTLVITKDDGGVIGT